MANLDRVIFSRLPDLNKNEEITIPKWCGALILIRGDILHGNYLELTALRACPWSPGLGGAITGGEKQLINCPACLPHVGVERGSFRRTHGNPPLSFLLFVHFARLNSHNTAM